MLLYYSSFLYKVRQRIEAREAIVGFLNWRSGLLGSLGLTVLLIWIFAASTVEEPDASLALSDEQDLAVQREIVLLVDDYWLETASTDQLLGEVSSFGGSQYIDLLAGY